MNNIGYLYENGEGVEKDINRAITWYEKAMMLGDDTAKNNIRRIYNDSYRKLH
jgi:TPR repeat protein